MAKTKYQVLVSAKAAFCRGDKTKAEVKRAAANYVHAAAIKADDQTKGRARAEKIANRVLRGGCKLTSAIAGKRKKKKAKAKSRKR